MAGYDILFTIDGYSASNLGQYLPVKLVTGATGRYFVLCTTTGDDVIGVSQASAATYGTPVPVAKDGITKALFAASCGVGARVAVASTNGGLGPQTLSGVGAGSGPAVFSVGRAYEPAAAGGIYMVVLDPSEVS